MLFISTVAAFLIKKVHIYQTSDFGVSIKKGNFTELAVYGIPVSIIFILCDGLTHYLLDHKCAVYYVNDIKYPTEEQKLKKAYTIVKWAFSLFYYAISSIAAFLIVLPTTFMPTWMGGDGYCTDVTRYVSSFDEANQVMKVFYIIQFGKHLGRFFQHVFIRTEGNFYEYALHHGLSTFLIFFSYLTNQWIIGIFVLLIHDVSDFFLILARAYREYKYVNKIVLNIFYVLAMTSWLFCRVFLLSACCVYSSLTSAYKIWSHPEIWNEDLREAFLPCGFFMGIMLFLL